MRHWAHVILHLCGAQSSTGHSDRLHRAAAPKKEERSSASSSENYCTNIPYYPHLHSPRIILIFTLPRFRPRAHALVCVWLGLGACDLTLSRKERPQDLYGTASRCAPPSRIKALLDNEATSCKPCRCSSPEAGASSAARGPDPMAGAWCTLLSNFECLRGQGTHMEAASDSARP